MAKKIDLTIKSTLDKAGFDATAKSVKTLEAEVNSGSAITTARNGYNALSSARQGKITNYSTLTAAETEYNAIRLLAPVAVWRRFEPGLRAEVKGLLERVAAKLPRDRYAFIGGKLAGLLA